MMTKNNGLTGWLGIKRKRAQTPALGMRELAVLEVLWEEGGLTAQVIHSRLQQSTQTGIGLNTVQSTIERLHRKELLAREKIGRAFYYSSVKSKTDLISSLMHDIASELSRGDMAPMISGFMDFLAHTEVQADSHGLEPVLQKRKKGAPRHD